MGFFFRLFSSTVRQAMIGLIAGVNLIGLSLFFVLPLIVPSPAEAGTNLESCFTPSECSLKMDKDKLCVSGSGCCLDDRCFVPDPKCGGSQGHCYSRSGKVTLSVRLGTTDVVFELGEYLKKAYDYALGFAAFVAAVMMIIGGAQWLTVGGDAGKVTKARSRITNAILGLVLAFGTFLLLQTINPDLLELRMPKMPIVKKQIFTECSQTELCRPCGEPYSVTQQYMEDKKAPGGIRGDQVCSAKYVVDVGAPGSGATCYGKSCSLASGAACGDDDFRCRKPKSDTETSDCTSMKPPKAAEGGEASAVKYLCMKCKKDGEACSPNGNNDQCCNGFCGKGKCTAGQPGDPCSDDSDCATRICQTSWGNSCSSGGIGSPCDENDECSSGLCQTHGVNNCSDGSQYSFCWTSDECRGGLVCNGNICWPKSTPLPESCPVLGSCPAGTHCLTEHYMPDRCVPLGLPGTPCSNNSDCEPAPGHAEGFCASSANVCTDGSAGGRCDDNSDCLDNRCYSGGDYDVCVTGGPGSRCDNGDDCLSTLVCQNGKCQK